MRILVTGGCGFVGSHVVDELLAGRHEVLAFDNLSTGHREFCRAKLVVGDIRDAGAVNKAFASFRPDVVVHTAAQVMLRKSTDEPTFDATTNVLGTINILEACRHNKVKKIIYTATGGACYGEPKKLPVPETAEKEPLSPYGCSKYSAELYVRAYSHNYGFDHLIFRFGNVYGPRDDPGTKRIIPIIAQGLIRKTDFSIFGDGKQTRDFLYVKDISRTVAAWVGKKPKASVYNLASGKGISINEVYDVIAADLGSKEKAKHTKAIAGEVRFIFLDIKKARKDLGFKPTPFRDGMRETMQYFRQSMK